MEDLESVREYYNANVEFEWERLERHPIEFTITKHFLDRYIHPGDRVLDIGGGPGRYSLYLAEKGCSTTLLDLSEENVRFALGKAKELGLSIEAIHGDACQADTLVDGLFDAVLLMGPMYHLLTEEKRAEAIEAALRTLKPGGILFVSFISLFAGFCYYMKEGPELLVAPGEEVYVDCVVENRSFCGRAFTEACFIAPHEVLPFMARFPLEKLHLLGQEGITSPAELRILACDESVIQHWIDVSLKLCEREEYLAYAEHLMYIGRFSKGRGKRE